MGEFMRSCASLRCMMSANSYNCNKCRCRPGTHSSPLVACCCGLQEVIMMLEQCRRDFSALIDRINVQDAFEKAEYNDRYGSAVTSRCSIVTPRQSNDAHHM